MDAMIIASQQDGSSIRSIKQIVCLKTFRYIDLLQGKSTQRISPLFSINMVGMLGRFPRWYGLDIYIHIKTENDRMGELARILTVDSKSAVSSRHGIQTLLVPGMNV